MSGTEHAADHSSFDHASRMERVGLSGRQRPQIEEDQMAPVAEEHLQSRLRSFGV